MNLPSHEDVTAAALRLAPYIVHTPLLRSPYLDQLVGGQLLIKAECLQLTGSFKIRGAFNRILCMTADEKQAGVVAWSVGNHGQALAFAGRQLGVRVTIVMPSDAAAVKIAGTKRWGAEIVFYDRLTESREEIGHEIARRTGAHIVPPYNDAHVIAGQGTAGLEAIKDALNIGIRPDRLLACTGGGGLIAGCALAAEAMGSGVMLHSVEPQGYDDTARSVAANDLVVNDPSQPSICDALMTVTPGEIPFAINRHRLAPGIAVTDNEVREAVRVALRELKIVVEPGGAAALAAALSRPDLSRGASTIVIVTGGNLDLSTLAAIAN